MFLVAKSQNTSLFYNTGKGSSETSTAIASSLLLFFNLAIT